MAEATKKQGKYARGQNPKSLANLKKGEWAKGASGNPAGKPLGTKHRSTIVLKWIDAPAQVTHPITKEKQPGTVEDLIVLGQVREAVKGNTQAFRELMDSAYGKQTEKTQHSFDLTNLSDEELAASEQLLAKLIGK